MFLVASRTHIRWYFDFCTVGVLCVTIILNPLNAQGLVIKKQCCSYENEFIQYIDHLTQGLNIIIESGEVDDLYNLLSEMKYVYENQILENFDIDLLFDFVWEKLIEEEMGISIEIFEIIKLEVLINLEACNLHCDLSDGYVYSGHIKSLKIEDSDNSAKNIPMELVYGVTLTLCGVFFMVIPNLRAKEWGGKMIFAGLTTCGKAISCQMDNNRKNR